MDELIDLHLTYDRGTPQEIRFTIYVDQARVDKIIAAQKVRKMTLEEAYDQTEEE